MDRTSGFYPLNGGSTPPGDIEQIIFIIRHEQQNYWDINLNGYQIKQS